MPSTTCTAADKLSDNPPPFFSSFFRGMQSCLLNSTATSTQGLFFQVDNMLRYFVGSITSLRNDELLFGRNMAAKK